MCWCHGALPTFEIVVDSDGEQRDYRLREWAWQASWTLQVLEAGATGSSDADFDDVTSFPTKEAALAYLETTTPLRAPPAPRRRRPLAGPLRRELSVGES